MSIGGTEKAIGVGGGLRSIVTNANDVFFWMDIPDITYLNPTKSNLTFNWSSYNGVEWVYHKIYVYTICSRKTSPSVANLFFTLQCVIFNPKMQIKYHFWTENASKKPSTPWPLIEPSHFGITFSSFARSREHRGQQLGLWRIIIQFWGCYYCFGLNFEATAASASISRLLFLWSQYKSIPTKIGKTVIYSFASNSYLLFLNRDRSSSSFFYI